MRAIVELLSEDLEYLSHEIQGDSIVINVRSKKSTAKCPYCGQMTDKVHSYYLRKLQDLPIQSKKVKLHIKRRKYFCANKECIHRTFAEVFDFFDERGRNTKRLQEEILRVSLTQSSIAASKYLKTSIADVGKSTICKMLKKGREKDC